MSSNIFYVLAVAPLCNVCHLHQKLQEAVHCCPTQQAHSTASQLSLKKKIAAVSVFFFSFLQMCFSSCSSLSNKNCQCMPKWTICLLFWFSIFYCLQFFVAITCCSPKVLFGVSKSILRKQSAGICQSPPALLAPGKWQMAMQGFWKEKEAEGRVAKKAKSATDGR